MHTMLASALLILSSSLCAYANFPQFSGSLKRSMLPAEWKDFRVVKSPTTSANPSAYLVTSLWYGDGFETCTSSPSQLYGFGFDSCLAGVDAGGQAIDYSLIYSYTSQDALYLYFNIANYTSNDCSGSYVNVTSQTPATCLSDGNQGWRYSYVASSTPWDSQPAGIVVKNSQSAESCANGEFNRFSYVKEKECYETTGDAQSETFDNCGAGKMSFTLYSDSACATSYLHHTAPLSDCYIGDGSSVYETMMCV